MQDALSGIINAYERDFAKHPDAHEFPKNLHDLEIHSFSARKRKQKIPL